MVNANYVNKMAMGINWLPADSKFGISPKVQCEIESGEKSFAYPEPGEDLQEWMDGLSTEQLFQAKYNYHNRWTWETGDPKDKEILVTIEAELEKRDNPPSEGDAYFDTEDQQVYIYDGNQWLQMTDSRSSFVDD